MSNQELILYEVKGRIATITINRPEKAHAFSINMLQMMHKRLLDADEDEIAKCILIKSTGERFFSAGYDLKEIQGDPEKISQITEWGRKVNETMLMIKKPIIAQVQGIAVGFGVLMILASDLRIFADRPKEELYLRLPEIAISAFPQTGATLLPLLGFGLTYAKNMLFTADKAGLEELKNINFPTRIVPLDSIDLETRKFLKILTKHQTEFLFFIKSMLTIMNKAYIKSCFDLEDECGKVAFAKKSMRELDDFIKDLHEKFP
ncbi:MAG: enoyl-CoA hydratase/isomerase family protein [Candidatus Lokiarchaeota archaeon]|nr:enoyl-CoA hydratase/isomerase family protein [Candidatus Lokiarchaeota archaeon]